MSATAQKKTVSIGLTATELKRRAPAFRSAGIKPPEPNTLPNITQMAIITFDRKLDGIDAKVKAAIREQMSSEVSRRVRDGIKEEQARLKAMQAEYGGHAGCYAKDVRAVQMSIHPDRPERSRAKLEAAWAAFERLVEAGK